MNKNKRYFKRTFNIIHAPDNLAQEVLNMAKNLDNKEFQNDTINTNKKMVTTAVDVKSYGFKFRGLAIAFCCVAIVGGSMLVLGSINQSSDIVSSSNGNGIGTSHTFKTNMKYNLFGIFDVSSDVSMDYECKSVGHTTWNIFKKSILTDDDVKTLNDNYNVVWSVIDEETYLQHNYKYTDNEINATQKCGIQFETVDNEYINIFMIDGVMQVSYYESGGVNLKNMNYYQCNDMDTFNSLLDTIKDITSDGDNQNIDDENSIQYDNLFGMFDIVTFNNITFRDNTLLDIGGKSESYAMGTDLMFNEDIQKLNECANVNSWIELKEIPANDGQLAQKYDIALSLLTTDNYIVNILIADNFITIHYLEKDTLVEVDTKYYQYSDNIENPLIYTMREIAEKNSTLTSEIEQEKLDEKNSITYLEILDTMKEKFNELIYIGQFNNYNDGMDLSSGKTNQDIINELYYMLSSHTYEVDTVYAIYDTTDESIIISNKEFSLGYHSINFDENGINFIVKSNGKIIYSSSNDYYVLTPTDGSNLYPNIYELLLLDKNIENPQTEHSDTSYIIIN